MSDSKSVSPSDALPPSRSGQPVSDSWTVDKAVRFGLRASTWVYTCAKKLADDVASIPLVVQDLDGNPLPLHPLQALIDRPNRFWSRQDFCERMVYHLLLAGNALVTKNRGNLDAPAPVLELWLVKPDHLKPVPDQPEYIDHYRFTSASGMGGRRVENADVVHLMFTNPADPYWGISPIMAGAATIDAEVEAVRWNRIAMQNRAVSDGAVMFDHDLNRDQWEEARYRLREQHMGSDNARIPYVFGSKARWQSISMSPVEMDFIESRRLTREEICAIFGVPPILVGILDRATYSNFETARDAYWQDTVVSLLANITDALTHGFTPDFPDVVIAADFSGNDVLNRITPEVAQTAERFWRMGVPFTVINERMGLGFPEFPGAQTGYVATSFVPSGIVNIDEGTLGSPDVPRALPPADEDAA